MLTSYFLVCKLWVLPLKTDIGKMLKQTNWFFVLNEAKNTLILNTVFNFEMFS